MSFRSTQSGSSTCFNQSSGSVDTDDDCEGFNLKEDHGTQTNGPDTNNNNVIGDQPIVISKYKGVLDFWGASGGLLKPVTVTSHRDIKSEYYALKPRADQVCHVNDWLQEIPDELPAPEEDTELIARSRSYLKRPYRTPSPPPRASFQKNLDILLRTPRLRNDNIKTDKNDKNVGYLKKEFSRDPVLVSLPGIKNKGSSPSGGQLRKAPGVKRGRSFEAEQSSAVNAQLEEGQLPQKPRDFGFSLPTRVKFGRCDAGAHRYAQSELGDTRRQMIRLAPPLDGDHVSEEAKRESRLMRFKQDVEILNAMNPTKDLTHRTRRVVISKRCGVTSKDGERNVVQSPLPSLMRLTPHTGMRRTSTSTQPQQRQRRPIVIDGCNVAYEMSNGHFESKRIQVCVDYFLNKGFTDITVVVPEHRLKHKDTRDPQILRDLLKRGMVLTCWSRKLPGGRLVNSYDDRMIVEIAHKRGGVIISNDRYRDLVRERPDWIDTISQRLLGFRFMPGKLDEIMFPVDPFGRYGPTLDEFLRF